jgi:hypothetical protein
LRIVVFRKLLLVTTFLLATTGCFDKSTPVPEAPVAAGNVNSCSGQHQVFISTGVMVGSRADHTATLLADGRVLLAGGFLSSYFVEHAVLDTSEVYDPSARTFQETGKMTSARSEAAATRLADGRVLITGGFDQGRDRLGLVPRVPTSKAEIFDPKTNLFTATGSTRNGRYGHSSVLLESGKALIAGGSCQAEIGAGWGGACSPELYDPDKGTFSGADSSGYAHNEETAIVLADGRVLLACAGIAAVPGTFSWLDNPPLEISYPVPASVDDTRTLISGVVGPDYFNVLSSEIFDSAGDKFSVLGAQHPARSGFTETALKDGTILIAGGSSSSLPYNDRRAVLFCP